MTNLAAGDPAADVMAIRTADAGFDQGVFMDSARQAFFAVKAAFDARDLSPIAARLAPGVLATLQSEVSQLVAGGIVHSYGGLQLDGMVLARAMHGPQFDSLVVRFDGRAAQVARDQATGRVVYGAETLTPFTEFWTFSRRAGALTGVAAPVTTCANCGAPAAASAGAQLCRYCGSPLPAPAFDDWTVTAIQDPLDFAS
jgi:predicted lipid-binding transport protein (Tim44 family)